MRFSQLYQLICALAISLSPLGMASESAHGQAHSNLPTPHFRGPLASSLNGATGWINSKPLTAADLRGKVVLVDFWDYSCINCIRSFPYVKAWADKYKSAGLVVIGVHTPEFDVEKQPENVQKAVRKFGIDYPVAVDNNYAIWNAFHNQYWPAHYLLDSSGHIRGQHFGEGDYNRTEREIQSLLQEVDKTSPNRGVAVVNAQGVQAAADSKDVLSPETYVGYARAERFTGQGGIQQDHDAIYVPPQNFTLNDWSLAGAWNDHEQVAVADAAPAAILYRFHARDLHMVLGPGRSKHPLRYRVTIDGHTPGADHGIDTDASGNGVIVDHRLYQLVRQHGAVGDHTFRIDFLDPGVEAFSFTFG